jgi:hypothetical protein
VVLVVAHRRRQRLGRQEGQLDGVEPALEVPHEGLDAALPLITERSAGEPELLRRLLFAVDRAEEAASLESERGLRVLGVAELAAAVRVIPSSG